MAARILLIDDEPPVLLTYALILQQHSYDVVAVPSASEARSALQEGPFDIVICDLSIDGERGGFALLEEARTRHPRVATFLLTGYASEEQSAEAEGKGITLLYKPIGVQNLLQALEQRRKTA